MSFGNLFTVDVDLTGALKKLDDVEAQVMDEFIRPAAHAGSQVMLAQVRSNVNTYIGRKTGNLRASIYEAFSPDKSVDGNAEYHISWRFYSPRGFPKAPHGHLIEFGTARMAARPFLRPAFEATRVSAVRAMQDRFVELATEGLR